MIYLGDYLKFLKWVEEVGDSDSCDGLNFVLLNNLKRVLDQTILRQKSILDKDANRVQEEDVDRNYRKTLCTG